MPYSEEHCHSPKDLEAFLESLGKELGFKLKEIHGRLVNKQIEGQTQEVDRRYFEYENDQYVIYAYGFCKNPDIEDLPLSLRGKVFRKDFLEHEASYSKNKPEIRKFHNEPFFGLGYQTPIDYEDFLEWGAVGCFGDMPARLKTSQFKGDLVASIKRMEQFDKNAKIKGELVRWNPKTRFGVVETALAKKVVIEGKAIPKEVKRPQLGLKLNLRIANRDEQYFAHSVSMG